MKKKLSVAAIAFAAAASTFAPPVAAQEVAGVFAKGRTHFIVTGGWGYAFDETYLILGLGATYYLVDGLGFGLNYEAWSGDPGITKLTPSVQYVFHQTQLKPYVGAFYRRTEIDGLPDLDSVGARAGVYFQATRSFFIGIGGVYESYRDCSTSVYRECESTYAEVSFTFAF